MLDEEIDPLILVHERKNDNYVVAYNFFLETSLDLYLMTLVFFYNTGARSI